MTLTATAFVVASCLGSGDGLTSHRITVVPSHETTGEPHAPGSVAQDSAVRSPTAGSLPDPAGLDPPYALTSEPVASAVAVDRASTTGSSTGNQRVSLRPKNNSGAGDLLDHWGHRHNGLISARLSQAAGTDGGIAEFRELLEAARPTGGETYVPEFHDGDTLASLGQRRGVTYGRWTGGSADTLSIEFDLEYATPAMRDDSSFRATLDRAGKMWSQRIEDTWTEWERSYGESKGHLIGNYGAKGREVRVGPGGETSTGLVIYMTGQTLAQDVAGIGGFSTSAPGNVWEPHTGAIALDNDYVEDAGDASLFATIVHETGHVLGAWLGSYITNNLDWFSVNHGLISSYLDLTTGTWTGPNVVAVHGGPAPFQDADDSRAWHNGERPPDATNIDYGHSGVCASVMAYCRSGAAIPAFLPSEIDFAFLRDLGLTTRPETERPETYGLAGWMDHSAFTLSVSRQLDVSLADPQPRHFNYGGKWQSLDTVDLLWAEADAFGTPSSGSLAGAFPLRGTVRFAGGLIGTAVDYTALPPVYGDANLSIGLESLTGRASFTSLRMSYRGSRYQFADGSLHYPIGVDDNAIRHHTAGVSLMANFYGPQHQEVAGTLDDSRAGLLASFGARQDDRPTRMDVIEDADHVRGKVVQGGVSDDTDGWRRYRCGAASDCEGKFQWWEPESAWYDVAATENRSPRERVLSFTAGWGDWLSSDMFADHDSIRIERRYGQDTDGRQGRFKQDGYYGVMEYAAFGTGFYRYDDWENQDGDLLDFYIRGTGFQGTRSGTRPTASATWNGWMVGHQSGLEIGEDPFVEGHARVRVSLSSNDVDIDFSNVTSIDRERSLDNFGYDDISLSPDGTFNGFDEGSLEGAFFGPDHQEVAGMFNRNGISVIGSFGAVVQD